VKIAGCSPRPSFEMQGSLWSWKTMEFCVEKFKALENATGPGKSWNSDLQVLENPGILVSRSKFFLTQILI
jgi:hypothetical protein